MVILTLYRKQLATINIMKTKLLMFAVLLITYFEVSAQKIYRTDDGHIEMMTLVDGKTIKAESHSLALYLDYNSKVVNGVLDLKTLVTDLPELNEYFIGDNKKIKELGKNAKQRAEKSFRTI